MINLIHPICTVTETLKTACSMLWDFRPLKFFVLFIAILIAIIGAATFLTLPTIVSIVAEHKTGVFEDRGWLTFLAILLQVGWVIAAALARESVYPCKDKGG